MKKLAGIFATAVFSLSIAVLAQDAPKSEFKTADGPDNDGKVSQEEMVVFAKARFAVIDTNKDGKISQDELKARIEARHQTKDANKDGALDKKEHAWMEKPEAKSDKKPVAGSTHFQKTDIDKDGVITVEEWDVFWGDFGGADADKDGKMSKEEYSKIMTDNMKANDKDGDGNLSEVEYVGMWVVPVAPVQK